jgi:hypothetical protein
MCVEDCVWQKTWHMEEIKRSKRLMNASVLIGVTGAPYSLVVGCDVVRCVYYHGGEESAAARKTSLSSLLT